MQGPLENRNKSAAQSPAVLVLSAAQALLVPYSASKPAKEGRNTNKTTLGDGLRQVEGQRERSAKASHIQVVIGFGRLPWLRK